MPSKNKKPKGRKSPKTSPVASVTGKKRSKAIKTEDAVSTPDIEPPLKKTKTDSSDTRPPAPTEELTATPVPGPQTPETVAVESAIVVGPYTFSAPFECHCCDGFKSSIQKDVMDHLATADHHRDHLEFVAAQTQLTTEESLFLNHMDLFNAPRPSKLAGLMARATKTPQREPTNLASDSKLTGPPALAEDTRADSTPPSPAASLPPPPKGADPKATDAPPPPTDVSPPTPTSATRRTRSTTTSTPHKTYGDGPPGDYEMAQALQDKELLRQSPSVKPMKQTAEPAADTCGGGSQPDPGADQRRGPHAPSLPWTDYVCNITPTH